MSEHRYREPVCMVVGLVVAAAAHTMSEQSRGSNFRGRVGAEVPGVVTVGPDFETSQGDGSAFDSIMEGDSVVAYSLIKIKVREIGRGEELARDQQWTSAWHWR